MNRNIIALSVAAAVASTMCVLTLDRGRSHAQGGTGTVTGTITLLDGRRTVSDRGDVAVYVEGTTNDIPAKARVTKEVRQRDLQFTPELVAVPRGSTVEFPNDDRVFHNVFSLSRTKRFDLGLYRSGESRSVTFSRSGTVDVYCNIHPDMIAQILILDTPHYAMTTSNGRFVIPNVPAGSFTVAARARFGNETRTEITVPSGGSVTANLRVQAGARPSGHRRKDGTPYGRYR